MRAEIKYFEWTDLHRSAVPASELRSTLLVFAAGPLDGPGEEIFHVTICTPEGLAEMVARDGVVIGRHLMFVASIDTGLVEATIRDRLRRVEGETWSELAEKIGRLGYWEFEDYTPHR